MPIRCRNIAALVLVASLSILAAATGVAEDRLYPTGPPNGVAYLRFVNLTSQPVTISSGTARITVPADDEQRVRRYDPVTPGSELTATVQDGGAGKPIKITLEQNELATIAVVAVPGGGPETMIFRETPSDFNASKASLVLYNADGGCKDGRLLAGEKDTVVISGVEPGKEGRRAVNAINVALNVACGEAPKLSAQLGSLAAGDRYSVFVFAENGPAHRALALKDEMGNLKP